MELYILCLTMVMVVVIGYILVILKEQNKEINERYNKLAETISRQVYEVKTIEIQDKTRENYSYFNGSGFIDINKETYERWKKIGDTNLTINPPKVKIPVKELLKLLLEHNKLNLTETVEKTKEFKLEKTR